MKELSTLSRPELFGIIRSKFGSDKNLDNNKVLQRLILALQETSARMEACMWCNLPQDLENSFMDKKMMFCNESLFRTNYAAHIMGTVEESVSEALIICYEIELKKGCLEESANFPTHKGDNVSLNVNTSFVYAEMFDAKADLLFRTYNNNMNIEGAAKNTIELIYSVLPSFKYDWCQYIKWFLDYYNI